MRTLGFLVVIAALVVGAIGVHQRRDAADTAAAIDGLTRVSAAELRAAKDGDRVIVEGTVTDDTTTEAPVSGDEVAWWSHERILRQQVETQDCTGEECIDVTRQVLSELGVETSGRVDVKVGEQLLRLQVPNDAKAVTGLRRHDTGGEPDPSGGDGRVEVRESVLVPGDRVAVAGRYFASEDSPSISKVEQVPLVHLGSVDDAVDHAAADRRGADTIIGIGAALLLGGIALFQWGRRRARARRAASATAASQEHRAGAGDAEDAE